MEHTVNPNGNDEIDVLAAGPLDGADAAILLALADFYDRNDPVPDGLADRLAFTVALAEMEAELAELHNIDRNLVGTRGEEAEEARTITFASSSLTVMVTVSAEGADTVRIDGWLAPAQGLDVDLRLATSRRHVCSEPDGRFVFTDVPHGLVTLVFGGDQVADTDRVPVLTPTFQL